jgi:ADP-dependent NAD(P)H-hydrate dehydratase / NAD(P)H-hydrate epimerase
VTELMPGLRTSWKLWLLAAALVAGAAAVAGLLAMKPLIRRYAEREARKYGFELELPEVDFGLGWLRFTNAKFSLIGVQRIAGSWTALDIDFDGLEARRFAATGIRVNVLGSVASLGPQLSAWTKDHPQVYGLPIAAREVSLSWRSTAAEPPWLEFEQGTIKPAQNGGSFRAERARIFGADAGKVGSVWTKEESLVALGVGSDDLLIAQVTLRVMYAASTPTAVIELAPTPLEKLSGAFGVALPLPGVLASGTVKLVFASRDSAGPVTGDIVAQLDGFVPPHPPELDGFVFGKVTTFESGLEINPEYTRAALRNVRVTAGAFELGGEGKLERLPDHVRILFDLRGSLGCAALASANLKSQLGKTIGPLLARAAREFLTGSVGVRVEIDADSRDLARAQLKRTIGVGCGLRPLNLPELSLPQLPPGLLELPKALPLPSALPPFPRLPPP